MKKKIGGFITFASTSYYWASNEGLTSAEGWAHDFGSGGMVGYQGKNMNNNVRAIRTF